MDVLAGRVQGFYYKLGGPQPKRVRCAHSWADSESIGDIVVLWMMRRKTARPIVTIDQRSIISL